MEFKHGRRRNPAINIIPMIDVVLLLLLFFMLTTTFKFIAEGITVDLPKTAERADPIPYESVISINRDGGLFYDSQRVSLAELKRQIALRSREYPDGIVIIEADKEVKHGWVVQVMDAVNSSGMKKMAIATLPK